MKRVFTAIAATFGFLGLAVVVIFFAENATGFNFNISPNSLTADISANNPLDTANAGASQDNVPVDGIGLPGQSADISATLTPAPDAAPSETPTAPPSSPPSPTPLPVVSAPAPSPVPTSPPPSAIPPYAAVSDAPARTDIATATVTVTPTAPDPPPLSQGPLPGASIGEGLALPYNESHFHGDFNWQGTWGATSITDANFLDLSAGAQSTGGTIYLKNSGAWANYSMNAAIDWIGGQSFGLIANYDDASNYVFCGYAKTAPGIITMQLVQYIKGYAFFLTPGVAIPWDGNGSGLNASIKVDGVNGSCSLTGPSFPTATVSNDAAGPGMTPMSAPGSGGVGFTINNPTPGAAEIVIKRVDITVNN